MAGASERLTWAVDALGPAPRERILGVGCGHGVAVSPICGRLGGTGCVVAIDRSPSMVAAASARTAEGRRAGRARVLAGSFGDVEIPDGPFDAVFAVNVAGLRRRVPSEPGGAPAAVEQAPG